jgi:hypothetical protein
LSQSAQPLLFAGFSFWPKIDQTEASAVSTRTIALSFSLQGFAPPPNTVQIRRTLDAESYDDRNNLAKVQIEF